MAENSFLFQLITPERVFFSGQAVQVQIPGVEGDMGVLIGHAPTITTLRPGIVTIDTESGAQVKIAVIGGIAEVTGERCSVLAETARMLAGTTREQLAAELEQAEAAIRNAIHEKETVKAEQAKLMAETVIAGL